MGQFELVSRCRHVRYVFFIDEAYGYEDLHSLILENQDKWGGRYNPIVPVVDGLISDAYLEVLEYFDPDFVAYSAGVDVQLIIEQCNFNPIEYVQIEGHKIRGVERNSLSQNYGEPERDFAGRELYPVVYMEETEVDKPWLDFLKLNIGASPLTWLNIMNATFRPSMSHILLAKPERGMWFKRLSETNHVDKHHSIKVNSVNLIGKTQMSYKVTEFVLARDDYSNSDLLYYWNRFLYGRGNIRYATVDQFKLLSSDKSFEAWLGKSSSGDTIEFVSTSLSHSELSQIFDGTFLELKNSKKVKVKHIDDFPFAVINSEPTQSPVFEAKPATQLMVNNQARFQIPETDFKAIGEYMVDVEISRFNFEPESRNIILTNRGSYQNEVLFPYTTSTERLFPDCEGRINVNRRICVLFGKSGDGFKTTPIWIHEFPKLLQQLVLFPRIHGKQPIKTILDIGNSDDSNKLRTFIESFDDFESIRHFLYEKFWTDIFEELASSKKSIGNVLVFENLLQRAIGMLKRQEIDLEKKDGNYRNKKNLIQGLKVALEQLCRFQVFLKGVIVKCPSCSSASWYSLDDLGDSLKCDGCRRSISVPVEPRFGYKLSNLLRNNLVNGNGGPDGNWTVIKSLLYLQGRSHRAFEYHPQINLYDDEFSNKPIGDLDIVCLCDGRLVIGEAKHNSSEFTKNSNKCLQSLSNTCKMIRPSEVVLACTVDTRNGLDKAERSLLGLFHGWTTAPTITKLVVAKPKEYYQYDHGFFHY